MTKKEIEQVKKRVIERVRAEFLAQVFNASGYEDLSGCDTCGGGAGHAFTLNDVHGILDGLIEDI